jgi:eukaryotic-like serine/threonine-protein kinase
VPFRPGETFDRYIIEGLLGEGGMGAVYLASDGRLERRVALKIVHDGAAEGAVRLVREARAAAALQHPNVVRVDDVGVNEGVAYIAIEYVPGTGSSCTAT